VCNGTTGASGSAACTIANVSQPRGAIPVLALFAGDTFYQASSASPPVVVRNAWATGVAYNVGDDVTFSGLAYAARIAHTSQTGWEPPNAYSLWERIKADTNGVWSVQVVYVPGDLVSFQGHHYRAIQGGQAVAGWEPPNVPALWQFVD
jgi:chitodextrinase